MFASDDGASLISEQDVINAIDAWPSKDCISLVLEAGLCPDPAPTDSYMGGLPWLPSEMKWPKTIHPRFGERSMVFLGQINCDHLSIQPGESLLPNMGVIQFFVAWDAEEGIVAPSCNVMWAEKPSTHVRSQMPGDILLPRLTMQEYERTFKLRSGDQDARLYPTKLAKLSCHTSLLDHPRQFPRCFDEQNNQDLWEHFYSFRTDFQIGNKARALGQPDRSWSGTFTGHQDLDDPLVAQHQFLGFPMGPWHLDNNGQRKDGKILLAQFDTQKSMDWNWNDLLTFWIHPDDLAIKNFKNVTAEQSKDS